MDQTILDNNEIRGINPLPNATTVLVLGILSIVTCFCYGVIGLTLGIIAIVLSSNDLKLYKANPTFYAKNSYNNLNAGRICAIIGVCLSAVTVLVMILQFLFIGKFMTDFQQFK